MSSSLIADLIVDHVREKNATRPTEIISEFLSDYGLTISYDRAWMAVEKARGKIFGYHSLSYQQIRWYVDTAITNNPGSHIILDCDDDTNRFQRLFVSFKASIDGFNYCRPLLFIDGTFLKGRYKGNILSATGKDGNQGLYPLAFAIVESENEANWNWFLQQLTHIVDHGREIIFVSDRNVGLLEAMPKVFPNAHHAFCLQHLKANLRDKCSGCRFSNKTREHMVLLLRECAYAPTVSLFNEKIEALRREGGPNICRFLTNLPVEHWANAHFRGKRYGEMSSNVAESYNAWISKARHLPITSMVDAIRSQIMDQRGCRLKESESWNGNICPNMDSRISAAFHEGRSWSVRVSSNDVYEVISYSSVSVDILNGTCTCYQWQINGFPCSHAVSAICKSGRNIYEFIDYYFHVSTYRKAYADPIQPIPTLGRPEFLLEPMNILPPSSKPQPGRPKKRRIRS